MVKLKPLITNIFISLGVGLLAAWVTMGAMQIYDDVNKPALSPPPSVFPVVWSILFLLMGISAYLIYISVSEKKQKALTVYGLQLVVNFIWPILFFNCQCYLLAFLWLIFLCVLILFMIDLFYQIKPIAGWLQIPYLLWVIFAGYLDFMVYSLNR